MKKRKVYKKITAGVSVLVMGSSAMLSAMAVPVMAEGNDVSYGEISVNPVSYTHL